MIRLTFLLLLLLAFGAFAANPNPVNALYKTRNYSEGTNKFYFSNGTLAEEFTIRNGNLHGTFRQWHKNGQLKEINHFDNGTFIDTCKQFSDNGNIIVADACDHDTLLYYCEYLYYKDGIKKSVRYLNFDKDSLDICPFLKTTTRGKWINFDVNLTIESMKSHGRYTEYYHSGSIRWEVPLVNTKYEGAFNQYYEDGQLLYTGPYHNDKMEGVFTYYNSDGTTTIEKWKNGKKVKN